MLVDACAPELLGAAVVDDVSAGAAVVVSLVLLELPQAASTRLADATTTNVAVTRIFTAPPPCTQLPDLA